MYVVSVRELCEFTAKRGDLDLRFTPAPTADEGLKGHAVVAARRGLSHASEVWLKTRHQNLVVRGRADGYDASAGRLEEVKTYRGRLERQPASHRHLHWAQAKVYAWMVCERDGLGALDVALVYYDIDSKEETVLVERVSAPDLHASFVDQCERFTAWALQESEHRSRRDDSMKALRFAHAAFRQGQRQLAEGVYNAARSGRCLLVEAPTGSGKTMGTLFPMLKAMPGRLDKLFYLTAKSSGRAPALDALQQLCAQTPQPQLRVLELVARKKACEYPDRSCHGESCPLASGFYDRLAAARAAAIADGNAGPMDKGFIRRHALGHQICPYFLAQELVRWTDVVVGDYNYWFDDTAMLYLLYLRNDWRVGLLVDEAHNLVDRAREMYSAALRLEMLRAAARSPSARASPAIKGTLSKARRQWAALAKLHQQRYQVLEQLPKKLLDAIQDFIAAVASQQAQAPDSVDEVVLEAYFACLAVGDLAVRLTKHSFVDLTAPQDPRGAELSVRNAVPALFTSPRIRAATASVLFSATLTPPDFYVDMLGLPDQHVRLEVDSPFQASQLDVRIAGNISTRYVDRTASIGDVAWLILDTYQARPGNYLAYFSSYAYLELAATTFMALAPEISTWRQEPRMDEAAQRQFVERFQEGGNGVAFAVLGGAFSEGVDLPGSRLIGTFIATLGMPPVTEVREEMRRRIDAVVGSGFEYTYLYPGMRKVVQAAGRVIRTATDQGSVVLMDDRFFHKRNRKLLPGWWRIEQFTPTRNVERF